MKIVHRSAIRDGAARFDVHAELNRLELRRADFDSMRTGFEIGLLRYAIEVVHGADEVTVDIYLCVALRHVDPQAAVRLARVAAVAVPVRRIPIYIPIAVRRVWIRGRISRIPVVITKTVREERTAVAVGSVEPGAAIKEPEVHARHVAPIPVKAAIRSDHDGPAGAHRTPVHGTTAHRTPWDGARTLCERTGRRSHS